MEVTIITTVEITKVYKDVPKRGIVKSQAEEVTVNRFG